MIEDEQGKPQPFSGCPWRRVPQTQFMQFCVNSFVHYRNGFLLGAGGLCDQPHWWVQAIGILSSEYSEIETERQDRQRKEIERSAR